MSAFEISNTTVEPGKMGYASLDVTPMPRGDMLSIPIVIAHGLKEGPVLGLESGSHGDEAFAIRIIHEALQRIDLTQLSGTIVGMPVCNPVAFESFTRLTGIGMTTDTVNLNTVFPGNPAGSLVEKMAYVITTQFVDRLDYLIDFHSGGTESAIDYTLVRQAQGPIGDQVLALSKAFGSQFLCLTPSVNSGTSISDVAVERNIPAIVPMLGGSSLNSDPKVLERGVQGVLNVLKHLGMIDGEPEVRSDQAILGDRTLLRHQVGGLFIPNVGLDQVGRSVDGGTLLGRVVNPYNYEVIEEYTAPFDSSILIMVRGMYGRVFPGDYAYIVADSAH